MASRRRSGSTRCFPKVGRSSCPFRRRSSPIWSSSRCGSPYRGVRSSHSREPYSGGTRMSAAGAAAAAAVARRRREEEESMTGYTHADLAEGWEFKILRSATGAFRSADGLRKAVEEERRAGWVLLEKFDNGRVRFKRPVSARSGDAALSIDPYRTS